MASRIIEVHEDFWNIRGSFRLGGLIDIGTQMSLARRANGKFVLLDACEMSAATEAAIRRLTEDGEAIEAILHLHPFHTMSVTRVHQLFPAARLHGSARHEAQAPDLPWQKAKVDDAALHEKFEADFDFSVPAGVDFISANDKVHFSSVLALHRASSTIHVDDTIMAIRLPLPLRLLGKTHAIRFHPTLAQALEKRAGAARDFRAWAQALAADWGGAQNLCAAHTSAQLGKGNRQSIGSRLIDALKSCERVLARHESRYG